MVYEPSMNQSNKHADSALIVIAALYRFADLPDYSRLRGPLLDFCHAQQVRGTLLLAHEGINGTIAGSRQGIDAVLAYLRTDARLADLEHKESLADHLPFHRMKVKLRKEIVTLGVPNINPAKYAGQYIEPGDWNELIADPAVLLIDTRNQYEIDIGTFKDAQNPQISYFREFPEYVEKNLDPRRHTKIAMFCTGGIRCEKATAYLRQQGYAEVYHLKGGILKYLEEVPKADSRWEGECFVFDGRVAVNHDLAKGEYDQCHGCRHPISSEDMQSVHYQPGVSCPYCYATLTAQKIQSAAERYRQVKLAEARGEQHIGATLPGAKPAKVLQNGE